MAQDDNLIKTETFIIGAGKAKMMTGNGPYRGVVIQELEELFVIQHRVKLLAIRQRKLISKVLLEGEVNGTPGIFEDVVMNQDVALVVGRRIGHELQHDVFIKRSLGIHVIVLEKIFS